MPVVVTDPGQAGHRIRPHDGSLLLTTTRARLALALIFLFLYVPFVVDHGFGLASARNVDLPSFYYASDAAFNGQISPYAPAAWQRLQQQLGQPVFPFLYPPPSLLLFLPFSWFSYASVKIAVLLANHVSLLALLYLLLFRILTVTRPPAAAERNQPGTFLMGWITLPLLLLYMLQFHPVVVTLGHGQVNLTVLVLLALFWVALRERRPGALTALPLAGAILLKTYPALFLPLLLIRRRWRTAGWTAAYLAGAVGVSWAVLPRQAWSDWFRVVLPTGGYANEPLGLLSPAMPWNQSVNGFAARLFLNPVYAAHPNPLLARVVPWLAAAAIVGTLVWLAVRLTRRQETRYLNDEFVTVLLSMFLIAPLSWEHHLVFVLPAAMLALLQLMGGSLSLRASLGVGLVVFVLAWPMGFVFRIQGTGPLSLLVSLKFYAVLALWGYFVRRLVKISRGQPVAGAEERPVTAAAARRMRRSTSA